MQAGPRPPAGPRVALLTQEVERVADVVAVTGTAGPVL